MEREIDLTIIDADKLSALTDAARTLAQDTDNVTAQRAFDHAIDAIWEDAFHSGHADEMGLTDRVSARPFEDALIAFIEPISADLAEAWRLNQTAGEASSYPWSN